jgi:hypothetical protein
VNLEILKILQPNDQVQAAGAFDVDFKTASAARSRATLGSAACGF